MIPENKNKFSEADKQYFRRNMFILTNFAMLQSENKEYVEALNVLSGNRSAPSATKHFRVTDYLHAINETAD